jgi:hypothetical protein
MEAEAVAAVVMFKLLQSVSVYVLQLQPSAASGTA